MLGTLSAFRNLVEFHIMLSLVKNLIFQISSDVVFVIYVYEWIKGGMKQCQLKAKGSNIGNNFAIKSFH